MKKTLLLLMLGISSLNLRAQTILDKTNWEEIYSNDFNSPLSSDPHMTVTDGTLMKCPYDETQQAYYGVTSKDNAYVQNGNLHLSGVVNSGKATGAQIEVNCKTDGNFGMLHGLYEIRCKMPVGNSWYAASWLDGRVQWPPELDMFEYSGNSTAPDQSYRRFFSTIHWEESARNSPVIHEYLNVSTGSKTLHGWITGLSIAVNGTQYMVFQYDLNNYMCGYLTAYDPVTGDVTINVDKIAGAMTSGGAWQVGCADLNNKDAGACICTTFHAPGTDRDLQNYFHTYSMLVSENEIVFFFDGKEIRTDRLKDRIPYVKDFFSNGQEIGHEMFWIISNTVVGQSSNCNDLPAANSDMVIDYIKIYQPKNGYDYSNCVYQQYDKKKVDFTEHLIVPSSNNVHADKSLDIDKATDKIYYIGTDHKLYNYTWTQATAWTQSASFGSVADMNNYLIYSDFNKGTIFYQAGSQIYPFPFMGSYQVYSRSASNGFTTPALIIGDFVSELKIDKANTLYYINEQGNIKSYVPSTGVNPIIVGTRDVANYAVNNLGTEIYYRGLSDNNMYYTQLAGGSWTTPVMVTNQHDVQGEILYDNCNDKVYYIGKNHTIWSFMFAGSNSYNLPLSWDPGNDNVAGNLAFNSDCNIIYYVGTDSRLWYYVSDKGWNSGTGNTPSRGMWYNHPLDWNVQNAVGGIKIRLRDDINYYVDNNNQLQEFYFVPDAEILNLDCNVGDGGGTNPAAWNLAYRLANPAQVTTNSLQEISVSLYPNPTDDVLNIKIDGATANNNNNYEFVLQDIYGKIIRENILVNGSNAVDIQNLPAAIYFVQVLKDGVVIHNEKIVKN